MFKITIHLPDTVNGSCQVVSAIDCCNCIKTWHCPVAVLFS